MSGLLILALLFGVFWFVLIRPQRARAREQQELISSLEPGDEIVTTGGLYGAIAELKPATTAGAGLPFGAAVWLIADEIIVPAFGLSKPPTEYPPSTHAYSIASHLVYGLTTEIVRREARRALD